LVKNRASLFFWEQPTIASSKIARYKNDLIIIIEMQM
jgi:hypothetical protein